MADNNKKIKFDFKVSKMRLIWYNTRLYQALFAYEAEGNSFYKQRLKKRKIRCSKIT